MRSDHDTRMPRKTREVICGILIAEVIQQKKRIELSGFAESECALELDAGSLDSGLGLIDFRLLPPTW